MYTYSRIYKFIIGGQKRVYGPINIKRGSTFNLMICVTCGLMDMYIH